MLALDREKELFTLRKTQAAEDLNHKRKELTLERNILIGKRQDIMLEAFRKRSDLMSERKLEEQKVLDRKAEIVAEKVVLADQKNLAIMQAEVNHANRMAQLKLLDDQITFLETRTDLDQEFVKSLGKFLIGMAYTVKELDRLAGGSGNLTAEKALEQGENLAVGMHTQLVDNIATLRRGHDEQEKLSWRALYRDTAIAIEKEQMAKAGLASEGRRLNSVEAEKKKQHRFVLNRIYNRAVIEANAAQKEINIVKNKIDNLDITDEKNRNIFARELVELREKRENAEEIIRLARQNARVAKDLFFQIGESITSLLKDKVGQGIRDLNTAFIEGTLTMDNFKQGLKDFAVGILQGIQETILEKAIIEPIQGLIGEVMGDLFNIDADKKPTFTAGSQNVHVTNLGAAGINGASPRTGDPTASLEDSTNEAKGMFDLAGKDIVNLGATAVATFGATLAATGDFKKSMIATFLAMFLQIAAQKAAAAIGSFFSSGGSVRKLAAGGSIQKFAAGGVMHRDSVPALLEPGEFVIRKPMAKAIGGPALQQMNAHGTMPAGNVEVNMINKGTPQSAQVEQKPQIDGKGIVIEIVLNDLKNNGPIKQAMRGGGSR